MKFTAHLHRVLQLGLAASLVLNVCSTRVMAGDIVLTPEQKSFFPKNDPIDAQLWDRFNQPWRFIVHPEPQKRSRMRLYGSDPIGVCRALYVNQQLQGGMRGGACFTPEPNPHSPFANRFSFPDWEDVDPLQKLSLIRDIFYSRQPSALREFQSSTIPHFYWWKMAPIIKRLLEQKRVLLQRARFDVDANGTLETVYALTLLPYSSCLKEDGSRASENSFLYIDDNVPVKQSFNEQDIGNMGVFFFDHKLVLFNGESIDLPSSSSRCDNQSCTGSFFVGPTCRLEPLRHTSKGSPQ